MIKIVTAKPKYNEEEIKKGAVRKLFETDKKELMTVIADGEYWKMMKQLKRDNELVSNGFSKGRGLRHIARIPAKMYYAAIDIWGEDVFTDKNKFKQAFAKDEVGEWTLLVPKDTI